jgi:hypothetical protein
MAIPLRIDPFKFGKLLWPQARLYDKQMEVVHSVERNRETYVVAGNKLGVLPPLDS